MQFRGRVFTYQMEGYSFGLLYYKKKKKEEKERKIQNRVTDYIKTFLGGKRFIKIINEKESATQTPTKGQ